MKELIIMRHAKSDWGSTMKPDFDRTLNKQGKTDAQAMGIEIHRRDAVPDIIISSPAKRARKTAKLVAEHCKYTSEIFYESDFYYGEPQDYINRVLLVDNHFERVLVIGHNPIIELLLRILLGLDTNLMDVPTASVFCLEFEIENWRDLKIGQGQMKWMTRPAV